MTHGSRDSAARGSTPVSTASVASRVVVVQDPQGLHMRPAASFAKVARQFNSDVTIRRADRSVNGKSQLDLLLLAAEPGAELVVEVRGDDAADALSALCGIFEIANWDEAEEANGVTPRG